VWMESDSIMLVVAIILTCTALAAALVFNVAYFVYVLPYMRRRRDSAATIQAFFGLVHGKVMEYCRLARHGGRPLRILQLLSRLVGFDQTRGSRFCRFNGVIQGVVSCWSLVKAATQFCLVFGRNWTTSGLRPGDRRH